MKSISISVSIIASGVITIRVGGTWPGSCLGELLLEIARYAYFATIAGAFVQNGGEMGRVKIRVRGV